MAQTLVQFEMTRRDGDTRAVVGQRVVNGETDGLGGEGRAERRERQLRAVGAGEDSSTPSFQG